MKPGSFTHVSPVPVRRGRGSLRKSRNQSSGGLSDESRRDLPVEDDDGEEANEDCETGGSRNIDGVKRGVSEEVADNHEYDDDNFSDEGNNNDAEEEEGNDDHGRDTSTDDDQETHGGDRVQYSCAVCSKIFSTAGHLKQHIQSVHEGIKYTCDQCGKQFTQDCNLRMHIQSVHEGVKYTCEECEREFSNPSHLKRHIDSIHKGIKYPCGECGKVFSRKSRLTRHAKKHVVKKIHVMRKQKDM